jgi:hypothetical protein
VIRPLDFQAVIDHANGADTVQSILSLGRDFGTLAVTHESSLTVIGAATVPTLAVMTGGIITANTTGILTSNLRAEDGGQIHLPGVTEYHATIFTSIRATGPTSLIDLPGLTSMMATTGDPIPGEALLDFIAELGGKIKLPALTSVRGHPPDYYVGFTQLRAVNGGTFLFDTDQSVTFAAAGSLRIEPGASVQAGQLILAEDSVLTVEVGGVLDATSVFQQGGYATVSGSVRVSGSYTVSNGGTTSMESGTVTVGDQFVNQGAVFGFGAINGDVTNAGMLSAGNLTVNGNFTQTATGQLSLRLRGADNFDQLIVTGLATLDGTLNLTLASGYQPQPGDQLQIVQFGAGSGAFARVTGNAPLFGILYIYQPREGVQPGVTLLF